MHPVLVDLDGFTLHAYGALGAAAFVVLCVLALRDTRRLGLNGDRVVDVIFWAAVAGILGSRLVYVLQNGVPLAEWWNIRSGLVFYGAALALPVGWGVAARAGLPLRALADVFGRLFPLAHGISRLGCFAAGCCYGAPSDLPWAVTFTDPLAVAPKDVPLHPVQLYEAGGLFLLFTALTWFTPRKRFDGAVLLAYLGGYAVLRIVTELFRGDADRYFVAEAWLGPVVSTSQAVALGFLAFTAVLWARWSRDAAIPSPDATSGPRDRHRA